MVKKSSALQHLLVHGGCGSDNVDTIDQIHEAGECFSNRCDALTACDLLEDFESLMKVAHRACVFNSYCYTLKTYDEQWNCQEMAGEKRDLLMAELLEKVNPADEKVYLILLPFSCLSPYIIYDDSL